MVELPRSTVGGARRRPGADGVGQSAKAGNILPNGRNLHRLQPDVRSCIWSIAIGLKIIPREHRCLAND